MSWVTKHKLRAVILVLMIVAFWGPWTFENIYVPSEYTCEFRLHDNLCGLPMIGLGVYFWYFLGAFAELVRGPSDFIESVRLIIVILILSCPLLPLLNTSLLVLSERYHPPKKLTITAWCLAIGAGGFFEINFNSNHFWALWGLWFFIGLSISALVLEVLFLAKDRKLSQEF